jgi:hypothetical protein
MTRPKKYDCFRFEPARTPQPKASAAAAHLIIHAHRKVQQAARDSASGATLEQPAGHIVGIPRKKKAAVRFFTVVCRSGSRLKRGRWFRIDGANATLAGANWQSTSVTR